MNPFAALITGLPSAETAARPGAPGSSPFGGGLFARLLEGESAETDAAANPLLASLGTLNTLPVIQANAPLPGLPVPLGRGQAPDAGALPLPLPRPGTAPSVPPGGEGTGSPPQQQPGGSVQHPAQTSAPSPGTPSPQPASAQPGSAGEPAAAATLPGQNTASSTAQPAVQGGEGTPASPVPPGGGEQTALEVARAQASLEGETGQQRASAPGSPPPATSAPQPGQQGTATAAILAPAAASLPHQPGQGTATAATAGAQDQRPARFKAGAGTDVKPGGDPTRQRPQLEHAPEGAPRPAPPSPQPRGSILRTVVNPASGQGLLMFQERTDADARTATGLDPAAGSGIHLRPAPAISNGPAGTQPAQIPVNAVAVHIAQQAQNGLRRFEIRLDPPELGRVDVRLDVSRDGQVTTHLVVERAETLDMLQRDARALERALQNAGLDTSEGGMKFSLKDQGLAQHRADDGNGRPGSGGGASSGGEVPEDPQDLPLHPQRRYVATTGLDIRI